MHDRRMGGGETRMDHGTGAEERAGIAAHVARILLAHSDADLTPERITPNTALIDSGLALASVDLLEALVEIEQALHVQLTDESLTVEILSSFALFVDHVCNLIPQGASSRVPAGTSSRA
jgi:acyl carrier protein